ALLDLGDDPDQHLVGVLDEPGALLALLDPLLQCRLEELVHAAEDRREGAAGEALVLLVEHAERDEVRGFELKGPFLLGARRLALGESAVHADDLERFLLEVVGLLDVEREDLIAHVGLDDEDRRNVLGLELGQHGAAMVAVRRPVHARLGRKRDDRVDEPVELLHAFGQALDVRGRQVRLVRARVDLGARQQAEDLPVVADRLLVEREHVTPVALDLLREVARLARRLGLGIGHPARHADPPILNMGAPTWPPTFQAKGATPPSNSPGPAFVAPRRSRGAPLSPPTGSLPYAVAGAGTRRRASSARTLP